MPTAGPGLERRCGVRVTSDRFDEAIVNMTMRAIAVTEERSLRTTGERRVLRGATFVAMMDAAEVRNCDNRAVGG